MKRQTPYQEARDYYLSLFEEEMATQDGRVDSENDEEREEAMACRLIASQLHEFTQGLREPGGEE